MRLRALTLTLSTLFVIPAFATTGEERTSGIAVTGECLKKVVQDRGAVTVASSIVAKTPKEASERAVTAHEAVKSEVKKLGLKDSVAETAGYSVYEECSYPDGRKACQGYRARLATRFETSEIGRLGDIIAVASKLGSEEVSDLQTLVSPELMQREREGCLEIATRNAEAKAQKIASGAGIKLGRVISISEGGSEAPVVAFPRAYAMKAAAMAEEAAPAASVEARPVDVRVVVSAVYGIE
jgi:hypothetical protein